MSSKFAGIFQARNKEDEGESGAPEGEAAASPPPSPALPGTEANGARRADTGTQELPVAEKRARPRKASPAPAPVPVAKEPGRPGRPAGKRSNPEYTQVTAYLRKATYSAVQIALIEDGDGQEFSELTEELLSKWLKSRT